MTFTNRRWQNHLKAKGFVPFMYDRLFSYTFSASRQYQSSPFNFSCENDEDDELKRYFFEFTEDFPYEIYIEFTNSCNMNCIFCARKNMKRKQGFMSMDTYKKLIDEIAKKRPFTHVHLYGIGESTIDPEIIEKIEYAIAKGLTNVVIFTNGKTLLQDDFYKKLADTGVGTIGIDMDGISKESYEKIRVGGNFEELKEGVILLHRYIKEKNLNVRVELAYQIYEGINDHEKDQFEQWAKENGYEYKFVLMHQWAGLRDDIPTGKDDSRVKQRDRPCYALWNAFMILWNGDVAVCFQDADGQEIMGNVQSSTIEEVWKGGMRNKRKEHVNNKFTGLCTGCKEYLYINSPPGSSSLYPKELREEPAQEPAQEPTEEPKVVLSEEPKQELTQEEKSTEEPTQEPTEEPKVVLSEEPKQELTQEEKSTEEPAQEPTEEPVQESEDRNVFK